MTDELFWNSVDKDAPNGCWEWTGNTNGYGYGKLGRWIDGSVKTLKAHRYSYEMANGPIPKGEGYHGTCVLHKCDNRKCVNPDHLFLGTMKDNIQDMIKKGRNASLRGENQWNAKLKPSDIYLIRELVAKGVSYRTIGRHLGVNHSTVSRIMRGKRWAHMHND